MSCPETKLGGENGKLMSREKTNYLLTSHSGEKMVICGMKEVAKFLGCVDSTVYNYQNSGRYYNGWLIEVDGRCECQERKVPLQYNTVKRIHYKEKNWKYHTFYPNKKTIALWKSFLVPEGKEFDFQRLDETVRKAIDLLVKKLHKDLDKNYIVHTEMPKFFNGQKASTKSIYYLELHFKFKELDNFKDWVRYLQPYINNLDEYIKKQYSDTE